MCANLSEEDYKVMLAMVAQLIDFNPDPGSAEGERLEQMGRQVEAYEANHFPIAAPSPF